LRSNHDVSVSTRRSDLVVFGLALGVSLLTLFFLWRAQSVVDSRPDPYYFSAMGKSLARGEGLAKYGEVLHRRGPLYPLLIGAVYSILGEKEPLILLIQCLLHAGTCFLVCHIGRRVFNVRTGLLAGVFCTFNPALLRYVPDFHLETLLIFVTTFAVWRSVLFFEKPTVRNGALFGVVSGFAALTKPVILLYPVVYGAIWFIRSWRGWAGMYMPRLLAGAAILIGMGVVIMPWTVRNYYATGGRFVLITTGASDAVLRGYVFSKTDYITLRKPPYTDAENESNAMFSEICRAHGTVWSDRGLGDIDVDKLLNQEAKLRIQRDPLAFVRKSLIGVFTFWYEMTSLTTSLVAGVLALTAWILTIVGLPRAKRERRPVWILLAPIVYLNLLLALLLALGRYSVPVLPCLWTTAAFGIDTLLIALRITLPFGLDPRDQYAE
jgi:4-amino-4-deoxy-L-arabinose transferase-like glycosyltransferase